MWPQALQMTRDECRGILRRLELESYSQVISVFRAQGGLSEPKAKLLEELRGIFHISSERHRAEARRVANDEQLATIAEAISGPNTWQEWSREGRRPYPMLPRVAPHTALALISNNIAEETAGENTKLPYPVETSDAIKEDHQRQQLERQNANDFVDCNVYNVVTSDPFKVPKIPASTKKNLKRNIHEQQHQASSGLSKKRATGDSSPQKNNHQNAHKQHYPHITANSPQGNNAGSTANSAHERKQQQQQSSAQQQHLQKQRFFHQQQHLSKQKMAKKSAAASGNINNTNSTNKRQPTPAKSGRRANQKLQMEQQQQKQALKKLQASEQQSQSLPISGTSYSDLNLQQPQQVPGGGSVTLTQQQLDLQFVSYAIQQNHPPQQIFMDEQQTLLLANTMTQSGHAHTLPQQHTSPTVHVTPPTLVTPLTSATAVASKSNSPQRAVSKRDISKNLNKLQQLQHNHYQSNVSPNPSSSSNMVAHELPPNVGSIISTTSSPANVGKTLEKSLISTTPVQKYIVEERQPVGGNIPTSLGSIVNLQNPNVTSIVQVSAASSQSPQIMTLPQFSAAATKLRAVNTTLIAPGNKMSPTTMTSKKISTIASAGGGTHSNVNAGALHELANVASTQSQVLHMAEQPGPAGNNSTNSNPSFNPPLHTPPAVIRLQSSTQGPTSTSSDLPVSCVSVATAQQSSGLLTTKILPLVLSGTSNQTVTSNSSSVVFAGSPTTPTVSTSTAANIIKNLPSTMVLNTSTSNLTPVTVTGTIFSTLGAGATMFRKAPNIIKTTSVSGSCSTSKTMSYSSPTSTMSTGAPHIISNVKLTPVNVTSSNATGTPLSSTTTFKNVLPSASGGMMRTSVKICQSPNGKVVIQPAGLVDGSKMKTLPHKIFTNATSTSVAGSVNTVGGSSGQRIAIQKVQIIPAPLGSPSGGNVLQAGGNTKTSPLAGKSNMIFMPSTAATNVRPVTLSKMGSNFLIKSTAVSNAQLPFSSDSSVPKTNIVVLGPSTPVKDTSLNHKKLESNSSLITDDNTPLDILNMPIVMDPGVEVGMTSSAETVTVLPSNIIESNNSSSTTPITILEQASASSLKPQAGQQTVILAATDWEMELDQAITTAAHNVNNTQQKPSSHNKQKMTIASPSSICNSSMNLNSLTRSSGQTQKRLNNELISIELKPKGEISSSVNSLNKIIVVDSFDEVIVEEHEDDMSTNIDHHGSSNMSGTATNAKNNENQPKILDMKIYQQHDGIVGGHKSKISIAENQQQQQKSTLKTITKSQPVVMQSVTEPMHPQQGQIIQLTPHESQHRGHQHAAECEVDAGFDETIVTEIDENTAIEYIEEDGSVIIPNMTTVSTTPATATVTVETNNMENELAKAKETIVATVSNDGSESNETELKGATIQSFNSCTSTNHLEMYAIQKNKTDAKSAEVTVGSLSQQQHETFANNSVT